MGLVLCAGIRLYLTLVIRNIRKVLVMNRQEFFKWLNACPTHKFEIVYDDYNGVYVNFTIADEPNPYVPHEEEKDEVSI